MSSQNISLDTYRMVADTRHTQPVGARQLLAARALWLVFSIASVILFLVALPLYFQLVRSTPLDMPPDFFTPALLFREDIVALAEIGFSTDVYAGYLTAIWVIHAVFLWTAGLVVIRRKSGNWMPIFTSIVLMMFGSAVVQSPASALLMVGTELPLGQVVYYFILGLTATIILLMFFLFPDGRFVPRWTRWVAVYWALQTQVQTVAPDSPLNQLNWPLLPVLISGSIAFGSGAYAQVYRYRHVSTPIQRQQTKWVALGFIAVFIMRLALPTLLTILIPQLAEPGAGHLIYSVFSQTTASIAGIVFASVLTISVLRYRLWDVDYVINRSLIYGGITLILGVVFVASVVILQAVLGLFNNGMPSPLAFAFSTLMIGGLFQPTHERLRRFVNRRFYHLAIDVEKIGVQTPITYPGKLVGTTLGNYDVMEFVGRGGMGEVYKAVQPSLKRAVAIKILPRQWAQDAGFLTRFEREARTVASLRHVNIVNVFDFGRMDDLMYMVMEYIEGQTLGELLKQNGPFSLEQARPLIFQIAGALEFAHTKGLVHRDVKPANIMIRPASAGRSEQAILMDFGIAKIVDAQSGLTGTNVLGTVDYVAPEQIVSSRTVDHRADVYALGVMVYEMLTGECPFIGGPAQVIFGHLYQPVPDPRALVPALPEHVAKAVMKAMHKEPEQRYQSTGEFAEMLAR